VGDAPQIRLVRQLRGGEFSLIMMLQKACCLHHPLGPRSTVHAGEISCLDTDQNLLRFRSVPEARSGYHLVWASMSASFLRLDLPT
jgi:hypothetical protein